MPRAPRRCPGDNYQCDQLIRGSQRYCDAHTEAWAGQRTASSRATSARAWKQDIVPEILDRDGHTCQIAYPGICTRRATVVDKVQPAARRPDLAHNPDNLRAACKQCNDHKARTTDRQRAR